MQTLVKEQPPAPLQPSEVPWVGYEGVLPPIMSSVARCWSCFAWPPACLPKLR
jgi:hypothetical protein